MIVVALVAVFVGGWVARSLYEFWFWNRDQIKRELREGWKGRVNGR